MSHWGELCASNVILLILLNLELNKNKIKNKRINKNELLNFGPLHIDLLSIIYGSLLGDCHGEKRKNGTGTRFSFYQEGSHEDYLLYLHKLISNLGYCNSNIPKIQTRLGNKGKLRKIIRFSTWTYDIFNPIYDKWYINKKKILPNDIDIYLTPLALAIWIMDDGGKLNNGLKIASNNFNYNEHLILINILKNKYNLDVSIIKSGYKNQYNLYFNTNSMSNLINIVKPYIHPSMKYKLITKLNPNF